jgi:hypothetical protein
MRCDHEKLSFTCLIKKTLRLSADLITKLRICMHCKLLGKFKISDSNIFQAHYIWECVGTVIHERDKNSK